MVDLKAKREELEKGIKQAEANLIATRGALQFLEQLIEEEENADKHSD